MLGGRNHYFPDHNQMKILEVVISPTKEGMDTSKSHTVSSVQVYSSNCLYMTWSHPRWRGNVWIMTFVPDSKSWSKGYRVRIFQIHMPNIGNAIAQWRLENPDFPPNLATRRRIRFYNAWGRWEIWVSSLHSAMAFPMLGINYCKYLNKKQFSHCALYFVSKTNENFKTITFE